MARVPQRLLSVQQVSTILVITHAVPVQLTVQRAITLGIVQLANLLLPQTLRVKECAAVNQRKPSQVENAQLLPHAALANTIQETMSAHHVLLTVLLALRQLAHVQPARVHSLFLIPSSAYATLPRL